MAFVAEIPPPTGEALPLTAAEAFTPPATFPPSVFLLFFPELISEKGTANTEQFMKKRLCDYVIDGT